MLKAGQKEELFRARFNEEDNQYFYMYCLDDTIEKTENCCIIHNDIERKAKNAAWQESKALLDQLEWFCYILCLEKEYQAWKVNRRIGDYEGKYKSRKNPNTPAVKLDDWRFWVARAAREEKYGTQKTEYEKLTGMKFDTVDDYLRYIRGGAA